MLNRRKALAAILIFPILLSALNCFVMFSANADSSEENYELIKDFEKLSSCPVPSASSAYLCCLESDEGLYSLNADMRLPMASTTKIMTGLLVCELLPLDKAVTVDAAAAGVEGSSAYLIAGEKITVRTLLYALMLQSANDAATQLAISLSGSVEEFARLMNVRAKEMGLENTHFTNPHGLDDSEHYTSASDLAKIACHALENELFAEVVSTKQYSAKIEGADGCRYFTNHNRLLFTYKGAIGMKTGYTIRTGRCLVSAAKRDGMTLVCVTLNDRSDWRDHTAMLDWGFENYCIKDVVSPGEISFSLPVSGGSSESAVIANEKGLRIFTNKNKETERKSQIVCPHFIIGGVRLSETVGKIEFTYGADDDEKIYTLPLVSRSDVQTAAKRGIIERIIDYIKGIFS